MFPFPDYAVIPRTPQEGEIPRFTANGSGLAGRILLQKLKAELNERRLAECDAMLTDAGVPEWVENSDSRSVPSNTTVARLKWYLARRKSVAKWEVDNKLQREMAAWLRHVQNKGTEP